MNWDFEDTFKCICFPTKEEIALSEQKLQNLHIETQKVMKFPTEAVWIWVYFERKLVEDPGIPSENDCGDPALDIGHRQHSE